MSALAISNQEVLRYLGYAGQPLDAQTQADIRRAIEECSALAQPLFVWRAFEFTRTANGVQLVGTPLALEGDAMQSLFEGAQSAALMAATLGARLDAALQTYSQRAVSYALLLDAAASTAIESVCDQAQAQIEAHARERGLFARPRFSPGYADLPLSVQPTLLAVLNAQRRIGLTSTQSNLLLPRKSVTAVVALAATAGPTLQTCAQCEQRGHCDRVSCIRNNLEETP